jgi:hypothetical protein
MPAKPPMSIEAPQYLSEVMCQRHESGVQEE